ncbi:hypothetical protein HK105_205475 [Polyrhizophydium stewartii]|uniref:Spindle pole body component n=1 Tax=Polyrhizophydium stewartii TaxID=2732419 RepID=A0ABR4N5V1_9FUNG
MSSIKYVSELDVLRECLFVLNGLPAFMFKHSSAEGWEVICRQSITDDVALCLTNIQWLEAVSITHASDAMLASLVSDVVIPLANNAARTINALAGAAKSFLQRWSAQLVEIESKILVGVVPAGVDPQTPMASLLWLATRLRAISPPLISIANFIRDLGETDLRPNDPCASPSSTALSKRALTARLLDGLFDGVCDAQLRGDVVEARTFFELFLATLRPLMDTLGQALDRGIFDDQFGEFFFNADVTIMDSRFWEESCFVVTESMVPHFLQPFAARIVHCIKMVALAADKAAKHPDGHSLWSRFQDAISREYYDSSVDMAKDNPLALWQPFDLALAAALESAFSPDFERSQHQFKRLIIADGRLQFHFKSIHGVYLLLLSELMTVFQQELFAKLESGGGSSLRRSPLALQSAFVDAALDQRLERQLDVDAFLLRWHDTLVLRKTRLDPREIFDNIRVDYQASRLPLRWAGPSWNGQIARADLIRQCPWPLSLTMSDHVRTAYSRVMAFLITMNYARHCLQRSHNWKVARDARFVREGTQLRMKLLGFLVSLQTYALHGVLQAESADFLAEVAQDSTIDAILERHEQFADSITERLFLASKAAPILKEINVVLDMCMELDAVVALLSESRSRASQADGDGLAGGLQTGSRLSGRGTQAWASRQQVQQGRAQTLYDEAVGRLVQMEAQFDDSVRFLVDGLTVMAAQSDSGVSVEILALSLSGKTPE